jgi:magnesium-protoporphyrin O-methyltransferase
MQENYLTTRDRLENYFDKGSLEAWRQLTSNESVSFIRKLVRQGRERMQESILQNIPYDLNGARIFDAGCGTGNLSRMLGERGAEVVGVDISEGLIEIAKKRSAGNKNLKFFAGDMNEPSFGHFDYIIAMDSLIHYNSADIKSSLKNFSARVNQSVMFTVVPKTTILSLKLVIGKLFPKSERSPIVAPVTEKELTELCQAGGRSQVKKLSRIKTAFYISEAWQLKPR